MFYDRVKSTLWMPQILWCSLPNGCVQLAKCCTVTPNCARQRHVVTLCHFRELAKWRPGEGLVRWMVISAACTPILVGWPYPMTWYLLVRAMAAYRLFSLLLRIVSNFCWNLLFLQNTTFKVKPCLSGSIFLRNFSIPWSAFIQNWQTDLRSMAVPRMSQCVTFRQSSFVMRVSQYSIHSSLCQQTSVGHTTAVLSIHTTAIVAAQAKAAKV